MTQENLLVLAILAVAVILFVNERQRVDLIALLGLITLRLTGLISIEKTFSGFASLAVITVWSVYIVSGGLFRTGIADILANLWTCYQAFCPQTATAGWMFISHAIQVIVL